MKSVSVMVEQAPPPPLIVMSLSLKIILNPKNGTNEVCGRGEEGRGGVGVGRRGGMEMGGGDVCVWWDVWCGEGRGRCVCV